MFDGRRKTHDEAVRRLHRIGVDFPRPSVGREAALRRRTEGGRPSTALGPGALREHTELPGMEDQAPGHALVERLEGVSLRKVTDYALVEVVAGWERVAAYAAARQAEALAAMTTRAVYQPHVPADVDRQGRWSAIRLAGLEVAARLGIAARTAETRVAHALDLTTRLVGTLSALREGRIDPRRAAAICDELASVQPEVARAVEAQLLPDAGSCSVPRLRDAIRGAVMSLDPAAAEVRHERVRRDRGVQRWPERDGMASLHAYLPADQAAASWETIDTAAREIRTANPDDGRTLDQLRADVLTDVFIHALHAGHLGCCNPTCAGRSTALGSGRLRPTIQVTVPLTSLLSLDDSHGELAGHGPIPASMARRIAADSTWRRLLTDPASGTLLDYGTTRYAPPADLVEHVVARDRTCRFPGCRQPAVVCQIDHSRPHRAGGPTSACNLGPLCHSHHIAKTHAGWRLTQPKQGRFDWRSPSGHRYLVLPETVGPAGRRPTASGTRPRENLGPPDGGEAHPQDPPPF